MFPDILFPITDINSISYSRNVREGEVPFFGYAPAETPVRILNCPICGTPVSVAHLQQHKESVHIEKEAITKNNESFIFQTNSRLVPLKPCFYAQRENYVFTRLYEAETK